MTLITSRQHAVVRQCRAIASGDPRLMLLDGWHLLADAYAVGLSIELVAVRADTVAAHARTLEAMADDGATVLHVSDSVMDALSPVRTPSGVVAIAARPVIDPRALLVPSPALVVAAMGVQDPGNVGALIRSADAGGATGVLLDAESADPWGWKALRAAMGSAFRLPVLREADAKARLGDWQGEGLCIVATDPRDGIDLHTLDLTQPVVFVMGAEGGAFPRTCSMLPTCACASPCEREWNR